MAINKVGSKGIVDGSVAQADFKDGDITSAKLGDGQVTNAKLTNSSVTLAGQSISLGGSIDLNVTDWQSVITADGSTTTTAVAGQGYFIDTTSAAHTINLPASANRGDFVAIKDYAATFGTNNLIIGRNGHNIQGAANDSLIQTNRASLVLVYVDSTQGWLYWEEHNAGDLQGPLYIVATGGTITTTGNYKIHSFTGDGCFAVSQIGNPVGGAADVSYMVVAGGGSGATNLGGGGAGGFREGKAANDTYTASPLNAGSGLTITATTYPVTVGGGGAAGGSPGPADVESGNPGSNSVFSTITSAGGGGGSRGYDPQPSGDAGGSGGGGSSVDNPATYNRPGGAGNTPPVSPPQGNPGGNANGSDGSNWSSGGGGGAGAAGGNAPGSNRGGDGGAGVSTNIRGVGSVGYAGGGAGGMYQNGNTSDYGGDAASGFGGGYGGGGAGRSNPSKGPSAGDANKGGGGAGEGVTGAGTGQPDPHLNSGGKGIVVIRYKYQN